MNKGKKCKTTGCKYKAKVKGYCRYCYQNIIRKKTIVG